MDTTEIRVDEHGAETHESWVLVGASRFTQSPPGKRLFDSEVNHQHYVVVTIARASRKRDLHHDQHHGGPRLITISMSLAQWGAFVSSFGQGDGVPATLDWLRGEGQVSQAPAESRLGESHREVLYAGEDALSHVQEQYQRVMEAFEAGGKRALREELTSLGYALQNAPKNMEFAARTLTEHSEAVRTKARADVEAMVLAAKERGALDAATPLELGAGEPARDER